MWVLCQEVSGTNIHLTRLENFARENRSSLLRKLVNYGQKSFMKLAPACKKENLDLPQKSGNEKISFYY
jgi:hypothetical protein